MAFWDDVAVCAAAEAGDGGVRGDYVFYHCTLSNCMASCIYIPGKYINITATYTGSNYIFCPLGLISKSKPLSIPKNKELFYWTGSSAHINATNDAKIEWRSLKPPTQPLGQTTISRHKRL